MNNKIERIYRILFFLAIIAAVIFFVTKCGNTKEKSEERISHKMMLTQIQHMGSLQVVKYTIQDIVEHEKVRTWLPNSKTILSVTGEVTGCIDLTKLQENDIVTIGDSVSITLPDPRNL